MKISLFGWGVFSSHSFVLDVSNVNFSYTCIFADVICIFQYLTALFLGVVKMKRDNNYLEVDRAGHSSFHRRKTI